MAHDTPPSWLTILHRRGSVHFTQGVISYCFQETIENGRKKCLFSSIIVLKANATKRCFCNTFLYQNDVKYFVKEEPFNMFLLKLVLFFCPGCGFRPFLHMIFCPGSRGFAAFLCPGVGISPSQKISRGSARGDINSWN